MRILGENLIKANSASEALNILLKTDIAVVLMDVSMPDIDGFELADMIRQHPRFQKTAIIFISGVHLTDSDRIRDIVVGRSITSRFLWFPKCCGPRSGIFVDLHRKTRMLESLNRDLEQRVEERTTELRKSEAQFRMRAELLDLATEAIIVRDMDDAIQFWNSGAEKVYGWRRDEAMGQRYARSCKPSSRAARQKSKLLCTVRIVAGHVTQTTKDGREIVVACRKTVNDEGDAVLRSGSRYHRRIARRRSASRNRKAGGDGPRGRHYCARDQQSSGGDHQYLLSAAQPSIAQRRRAPLADMAEEELERVSHITRQTLSFYRESKQPIPVVLPEVLDDVLELQKRVLKKNHIKVRKIIFRRRL